MQTDQEQRLGDATYSPEDNKIRFYPFARLSKEDYARARAAGFIWAPKQELFVAPMWTTQREDLMLEWCGELGDEDTSLVERAEERADRFQDYSQARASDSASAHKAVSAIADHIPLGQPILVGHHSEKRARRDAERIDSGMRKAVKMWEQSQYWKERAAGAVRAAKYKERPDVRARRIKKLEAEKRKEERRQAEAERSLKLWLRPMTLEQAYAFAGSSYEGHLGCCPSDHGSMWSAYNVLERGDRKYKGCPDWTVEQVQERAQVVLPRIVANCKRWIAHYENRLTYERAMLEADGGTVAERTGPELGGACRCWCNNEWSKIHKVNKVSVTVLRNFGNGGSDFTTTVPFTDLYGVMSKAQVDQARAEGRILAENARGFALADGKPNPDRGTQIHRAVEEMPAELAAIKATLENGGVKVVSAPNLFPTPKAIADQLCDLADLFAGAKVLEPSAGTGNLLEAMVSRGIFRSDITAVELNLDLAHALTSKAGQVLRGDFLELSREMRPEFDRVVMNPPFDHGSDIKHVQAAFNLLAEGGVLAAIVAAGPAQREAFSEADWIDLPAGSFACQGTGVQTAIIIWGK